MSEIATTETARGTLFSIGARPCTVNGWRETLESGRTVVRIEWREPRRKTKSWEDTAEGRRLARAYARGVHDRLQKRGITVIERHTLSDLFDKFVMAKEAGWRPKTRLNALNKWRLFQEVVGPNTAADLVTEETLDEVRRALRLRKPRAIVANQIQKVVALVKEVWKWARRRKLIGENAIAEYENLLPKDGQPLDVPEYTPEECARILANLSYRDSRTWRAAVAIMFDGLLGPRQNALLNVEWRDIDLVARTVTWRAELDKLGRNRVQPLPTEAVFALRIAKVWRARQGYDGRFVFFAVQRERRGDKPWTYAALIGQLRGAERRAKVPHIKYRGMHGFRRMAVNNVLALTGGDLNAAGNWIGDRDLRTLKRSYIKERPEELRAVARGVSVLGSRNTLATEQQRESAVVTASPSNPM